MNTILSDILFDTSYLFIIAGSLIAFFFGLALIIAPATTLKLNAKINKPIFSKKIIERVNIKIKAEPFFYRHAKISGAILITGSLFVLYTLATFNFYLLIPYFPKQLSTLTWGWLLHAGQIFFFICSSFILVFGFVVFIRPSLIKNFEANANRWFSTQTFFIFLSKKIDVTNKLVVAYPRIVGLFITVFALLVLFFLLPGFKNLNILGI
jgi:hypothetical protein